LNTPNQPEIPFIVKPPNNPPYLKAFLAFLEEYNSLNAQLSYIFF
jgi:hypothetical protein